VSRPTKHSSVRKLTIPILAASLALTMAPTTALAKAGMKPRKSDIAATEAYIAADYALVHTARTNMLTGEAALEELRSKISAECPMAAASSPENEAAEKLSNEVVGTMGVAFIRSDTQAVAGFVGAVSHLHWSNSKLTRKATTYASKLKVLAALSAPGVCGDVRAWAASGYRTLPTSTVQFDRTYSVNDVGIGEVPAHLLAPYEDRAERVTLQHTAQFENELVDAEARAVEPWSKILDALNLQP
jgi:hypothetical protein